MWYYQNGYVAVCHDKQACVVGKLSIGRALNPAPGNGLSWGGIVLAWGTTAKPEQWDCP